MTPNHWNWQHPDWPRFQYRMDILQDDLLAYTALAHRWVGCVSQLAPGIRDDMVLDIMMDEAMKNAAIEGVSLPADDLRSSLKNHLGLHPPQRIRDPRAEGMAQLVLRVRQHFDAPLTAEDLCDWQTLVTQNEPRWKDIAIGSWRHAEDPMQIVSGPVGAERVHFQAPPASALPREMDGFLMWFDETHPHQGVRPMQGVIRAGLAHLYFESLHPFDDGNGRVGRALAEKALAQALGAPVLFSLSAAIERTRKQYYEALGHASLYTLEVTPWLSYFVATVYQAQQQSETLLTFVLAKARFFTDHTAPLNDRQKKVLNRMFAAGPEGFEGGMSAAKYQNLTKTSKPTATRDLSDLLAKGYLRPQGGGGRSTRYGLNVG